MKDVHRQAIHVESDMEHPFRTIRKLCDERICHRVKLEVNWDVSDLLQNSVAIGVETSFRRST